MPDILKVEGPEWSVGVCQTKVKISSLGCAVVTPEPLSQTRVNVLRGHRTSLSWSKDCQSPLAPQLRDLVCVKADSECQVGTHSSSTGTANSMS